MRYRSPYRTPMCNRPYEVGEDDYRESYERTPSGEDVRVTRYKDGSSTVHWGGPCGSTQYDEYGEEC